MPSVKQFKQFNTMKFDGSIIKKTREENGYTQWNFSRLTGISQGSLSKVENNKSDLRVSELEKIADSLAKPIHFFFLN
jgi:transcriptional regulator with XRE-family HTH domain